MRPATIVLIPTCNAYADAWEPFRLLANRSWIERPPLFLATDLIGEKAAEASAMYEGVIVTGAEKSWCQVLRASLDRIAGTCGIVLLMQEDFLVHTVDGDRILDSVAYMYANPSVACFRLYPCPGADGRALGGWFGEITRDAPYRVSCQAALWRVDRLRVLLDGILSVVPAASAADFELRGTPIARDLPDEFVSANDGAHAIQYLCSAITRGEWTRDAAKLCASVGVDVMLTGRPVMKEQATN
jgi:hypothetical protein